jgi:hypothetical protein
VPNLVVRVWLPDRPGALGLVASRIGAIGGDIVGIDVLERGESIAVDEVSVVLPRADLAALLVREIEEVDGASVEEWREVDTFSDAAVAALESVEVLCGAADIKDLAELLVARSRAEFAGDWSAVLQDAHTLACEGDGVPNPPVLDALAAGTAASPAVACGDSGPDDLAVAPLAGQGAVLLVGRAGHPFRRRERLQLLALARIADRLALLLSSQGR